MSSKSFVTSDGATINYVDEGTGDVLVLLHGWAQSAVMFRHQVAHLSRNRRVIAPDFRGHGTSPAAAGGYRIARFAADVAGLLAHENISRATILGWSMGASVLWAFIDQYGTARLDGVIFVDEPASVMRQHDMSDEDAVNAGALFDAAALAGLAAQIAGGEGHATRSAFLDSMVTKTIAPDLKAFLLAENLITDGRDAASLIVNHCMIDWRDIFARVDVPALVIGGRVSHVAPRSQEWIHRQIPHSELVIFEADQGGAHFPFIEAPDIFNTVLERFLASKKVMVPA